MIRPTGIDSLLWYGLGRVAFSPDGKLLAATYGPRRGTGGAGVIVVWDVSGKEVARFAGKDDVAFAPDGTLAYGNDRPIVGFYHPGKDSHSTLSLDAIPGREWYESASRLAFSRDGKLAVGLARSLVIVESGKISTLPRKHQADIDGLCWSPDGTHLYSSERSYLRIWKNGDQWKRVPLANRHQLVMAGDWLATAGTLQILPLEKGLPKKSKILLRDVESVATDGNDVFAAAGGELHRIARGKVAVIGETPRHTCGLACSPDGKTLASFAEGTITLTKLRAPA